MYKSTIISLLLILFMTSESVAINVDAALSLYTTKCLVCHSKNNKVRLIDENGHIIIKAMQKRVINDNLMPPWPPDNTFQQYRHNRALTTEEKALLQNWLDTIEVIKYEQINTDNYKTDLKYSIRKILLPKNEQDTIWQYKIQCNNENEISISQVKISSNQLAAIHHCNYFFSDGENEISKMAFVSGYSPGNSQAAFEKGCGFILPKKAVIIGELHIPPHATPLQFDFTIGLNIAQNKIDTLLYFLPFANLKPRNIQQLVIPPDTIITFEAVDTLKESAVLYAVNPHMHLLGKSMTAFAVVPMGDTIPLIRINNWDFNWQDFYTFDHSVFLPANTRVYISMTYDNTAANKNNPSSPPVMVTEGWFTNQEMFTFLVLAKKRNEK